MLSTFKKNISFIKAQTEDLRDCDQSVIFTTGKFLIISAQQTVQSSGDTRRKKKSRYLLQALEPEWERQGYRQTIRER